MISDVKASARAALHEALSEPASYTFGGDEYPTPEQTAAGLTLTIRWHTKLKIIGERSQDDVGVIEGINRIVFNKPQLEALGIEPARLGVVDVPGFSKSFRLDYKEEGDGPINQYWSVVELSYED